MISLTPATARAITEICDSSFVSSDIADPDEYDPYGNLDGNDIYMRYATTEFLSSGTNSAGENYYVLAWVTARNPATRERKLRVAITRDWPPFPNCTYVDPSGGSGQSTFQDLTDVNWVQHGGHVPAGQSGRRTYPSQGYLVWSDAGDEFHPPEVAVSRYWEQSETLQFERAFLELRASPTAWYWGYPVGITPSMASNRPVPANQNFTSGAGVTLFMRVACQLASGFGPLASYFARHCDHGHRLLLVYSGDPRWITERKQKLEDVYCNWDNRDCSFWVGSSIRFKLFRPGDNKILHEGSLADVRTYREYDAVLDHAVYPEVVWNEAAQKWLVMWEEHYLDSTGDPRGRYSRWKARTVDLHGNLGPTRQLGWCTTALAPTSHGDPGDSADGGASTGGDPTGADDGGVGDDRPPVGRIGRSYCYPINLANDYYSLDGISAAGDRNPGHYSLFSNYLAPMTSYPEDGSFFEWLDDSSLGGPIVSDNIYGHRQMYKGDSKFMNIGVIGYPYFRDRTEYKDASYLKMSYDYDMGYGCKNVFYLISHDPEKVHTEGIDPDQQYYRVDGNTSWDHDCSSRYIWSVSSSLIGFVALYAQWVPSQSRYEMRYGTYLWLP